MPKLDLALSCALYPVPVVLVSCADKKTKRPNIITIAWCGIVCSAPPCLNISIRASRFSYKIIKNTGDFVINIPTSRALNRVDMCGNRSGGDTDKFGLAEFTDIPSSKISSPMIKECPVNIECKLMNIVKLGSHDMFIGNVLAVHADAEIIGPDGNIDYGKADPLVYNQGEYWNLGKKIGRYGCSQV